MLEPPLEPGARAISATCGTPERTGPIVTHRPEHRAFAALHELLPPEELEECAHCLEPAATWRREVAVCRDHAYAIDASLRTGLGASGLLLAGSLVALTVGLVTGGEVLVGLSVVAGLGASLIGYSSWSELQE